VVLVRRISGEFKLRSGSIQFDAGDCCAFMARDFLALENALC